MTRNKPDPNGNCRPIILDPADPTGNLSHNARWDLLAEEAAACMSALCCMSRDGTPIRPWPVKVREQWSSRDRLHWGQRAQGGPGLRAEGQASPWPHVHPLPCTMAVPVVSASPGRLGLTSFFCHLPPGCCVKARVHVCTRWTEGHQPLA